LFLARCSREGALEQVLDERAARASSEQARRGEALAQRERSFIGGDALLDAWIADALGDLQRVRIEAARATADRHRGVAEEARVEVGRPEVAIADLGAEQIADRVEPSFRREQLGRAARESRLVHRARG